MKDDLKHQFGSDNIFADLGLPNADELLAKTDLAFQISRIVEERGLTQAEVAEILGIDQPKVSALVRGKVSSHSMERLYRYLNALGQDIEIVVRPKPRGRSRGIVRVHTETSRMAAEARNSTGGKKAQTVRRMRKTTRLNREGSTR